MLNRIKTALQEFFRSSPKFSLLSSSAREAALDTLARHGIDAFYYLPAAGCTDEELAAAMRLLGQHGYLMTDAKGELIGRVAKARLTSNEKAKERRKRFTLVDT